MLYPGSRFRMADELLETYTRQLIEAHARAGGVQDNVLTTVHAANEHRGIEVYPVPARRVRRAVHGVHPGDRARGRSQRQWRAALVIVA